MKKLFRSGDQKFFKTVVTTDSVAAFNQQQVHPVYSTFALAKDAEWTCRLFVLAMKEDHEEGIGTHLSIDHLAPALVGSSIEITATLVQVKGNSVHCSFEAKHGNRLLARGTQTQKILLKSKLSDILTNLSPDLS